MSRVKPGKLAIGIVLFVSFTVVLVLFFLPLYGGMNGLDYLDNLYNSISKGSAYYIPKVQHQVEAHGSDAITLELKLGDAAEGIEPLFAAAGATTSVEGDVLLVRGDLEKIFAACLIDADAAYHNRNDEIEQRYGVGARATLYRWWKALHEMEKDLTRQKRFEAAELTHTVQAKAVECAYNYDGIEAQKISDRWGIVLFSLVFYVIYTVWYGYAIMYIFEGLGFELAAH